MIFYPHGGIYLLGEGPELFLGPRGGGLFSPGLKEKQIFFGGGADFN